MRALTVFAVIPSAIFAALFIAAPPDKLTLETTHLQVLRPHPHTVGLDSATDEDHHVEISSGIYVAPEDLWVRGMNAIIRNTPPFTVHHATLMRLDGNNKECPTEAGEWIVSFTQDQSHNLRAVFPKGYAMFIPKGAMLRFNGAFHNPEPPLGRGETYKDVYLQLHLDLVRSGTEKLTPVSFHLLRLADAQCRSGESGYVFAVAPRSHAYSVASSGKEGDTSIFVANATSTIVYWGGHLHGWEGGERLIVRKNGGVIADFETKKAMFDRYRFDTPHGVTSIHLEKGDTISLEAIYDNPTDSTIRGAMGQLGIFLAEE